MEDLLEYDAGPFTLDFRETEVFDILLGQHAKHGIDVESLCGETRAALAASAKEIVKKLIEPSEERTRILERRLRGIF